MTLDPDQKKCFHCGLPVPEGTEIAVSYQGEQKPMCCYGCQAVAKSIVDSGMEDFYRYRTDKPLKTIIVTLRSLYSERPALARHLLASTTFIPMYIKTSVWFGGVAHLPAYSTQDDSISSIAYHPPSRKANEPLSGPTN